MEMPTLVFDHINRKVHAIDSGAAVDDEVREILDTKDRVLAGTGSHETPTA